MRNRGYTYTTQIGREHAGQTVLDHLARLYPHTSATAWQRNLHGAEVTLNGAIAEGREILAAGQTLVWHRPPWNEPDAPQHFDLLYEDAHLLAVAKPAGLPTLPGGGFLENSLLRLVQQRSPAANPVHRLGRATTGIVLFAKSSQVAARLTASWNSSAVQKVYRALAQGVVEEDTYEILTPIGLVPHPRLGSVWAVHPAGRPSRSNATVIERTGATTTFAVTLHSGRPHQIRIHLASIGHPLVGDPLYAAGGQPLAHLPGLPGDGGYQLHAQFLSFLHPITGTQISLKAPLPPTWVS